ARTRAPTAWARPSRADSRYVNRPRLRTDPQSKSAATSADVVETPLMRDSTSASGASSPVVSHISAAAHSRSSGSLVVYPPVLKTAWSGGVFAVCAVRYAYAVRAAARQRSANATSYGR